jgi:hypothetical protein
MSLFILTKNKKPMLQISALPVFIPETKNSLPKDRGFS